MKNIPTITRDTILQTVLERREADYAYIRLHEVIKGALAKWEGKKLNRRAQEQVKAALQAEFGGNEPIVVLETTFSGAKFIIWGGNTPMAPTHDKRLLIYLGSVVYSPAEFESNDACHGSAALARNEARIALLLDTAKIDALVVKISAYYAAAADLGATLKESFDVDRYAIERASKLDNATDGSRISFGDFGY